jgi:AcrR family transcriptional regulator
MANKEDLRIVKTKAALSSAFYEMLKTTKLEDMTVNELCDQAGVRRATFYKHFKDKNDFIAYLIKDLRDRFDRDNQNDSSKFVTKEYYLKYAEAVITYLCCREAAIRNVIDSPMRSVFVEVFMHQNYEDTKKRLEESVRNGMTLVSSVEVVTGMLVGGITQTIIHWLESDDRCSSDTLLRDISRFIDKVLS